jgi:predicted ATPase
MGGLEVDGARCTRRKLLALLAFLVADGPQPRERLTRLFWPDAADPRNRLSVGLHRLQQELPGSVRIEGPRVAAALDGDVTELREALARRDVAAAQRLHAGPFLDGVRLRQASPELETWLIETREELADGVRSLLLRAARAEAAEGRYEAAAAHAEAAERVAGAPDPGPSTLARWHALALAGGSPVADRLARDARELGLRLPERPEEARAQLASLVPPSRLPRAATTFVGRARERVELGRILADPERPLLTLLGPGGIGKTRLALALAHDQLVSGDVPGGVFFVPLETVEHPDAIAAAIAEALGAAPRPAETHLDAVARTVGDRRTLLVLDNVDRLVEGAPLVAKLLAACPAVEALATSRARLELEEESVFPLEGLVVAPEGASPDAVAESEAGRLFLERARRARLDVDPGPDELRAIGALCRLLGGAPLAIELAAVWIRDRAPSRLLAELRASYVELGSPSRSLPDRHRTLRACFAYSWRSLTPDDRWALARLGVFQGGFEAADALAVADVGEEALGRLRDRSLVSASGPARATLHPIVAAFARERLAAWPEAVEGLHERHARHYAGVLADEAGRIVGAEQADALARLERERGNLEAAQTWALGHDPALAADLVADRTSYWRYRARFAEGREAAERALGRAAELPAAARIRLEVTAGAMSYRLGALPDARAHLEAALAEARRLGGEGADAGAWQVLGDVAHAQRRLDEAARCFDAALRSARARADEVAELQATTGLGRTAAIQGDYDRAADLFDRALRLAQRGGSPAGVATAHFNVGALARDRGDLERAEHGFARALAGHRELGDRGGVASVQSELAGIAWARDDLDAAEDRYRQARATWRAIGDRSREIDAVHALGWIAARRGRREGAAALQREALRGWLAAGQEARGADALWALASLATEAGRPDVGAVLWGAEAALRERYGIARSPARQAWHERDRAATREALGAASFERIEADGRRLAPAEAAWLDVEDRSEPARS